MCVNITILDDSFHESDEHFILMMTLPNTATEVNTVLSTAVTNITIIDDSGKINLSHESSVHYVRMACLHFTNVEANGTSSIS